MSLRDRLKSMCKEADALVERANETAEKVQLYAKEVDELSEAVEKDAQETAELSAMVQQLEDDMEGTTRVVGALTVAVAAVAAASTPYNDRGLPQQ